ncbi:flagellar protein FlgN [Glutamicibacter sp. MCAF14]|uniref:flagellar protein FlgN n=1 Tax=Glutamicibacter sp. MCAF14 TaxID=3233043 RepID=UPI003F905E9E
MGIRVNELSGLLFEERETLELLRFKLEELNLLLVAGKAEWVARATSEIEKVLERVHHVGLKRALVARQVASDWDISPGATLSELAEHAPDGPWGEILTSHLGALREITAVIATVRDSNAQYLRAVRRSTQEALSNIEDHTGAYGPTGSAGTGHADAQIIDTSL